MTKNIPILVSMLLLASCSGWVIQPGPANPPTPFLPPTNTPSIHTATPVIIAASLTASATIPTSTSIPFITATTAPTLIPSETPANTETSPPGGPTLAIEILGCNTSIDVTHGMGEVTNAFVRLSNTGIVEITNLQVVLNARDEGREHPDKRLEVPSLLAGYEVMLKLTVDSTYQEETPIQVEVTGDAGLFQRVGSAACEDIGVLAPNPEGLNTPAPKNP
jgi:hypothetical protein